MIIEQAFLNLPEVLVGARYPLQDYEAGIVGAFGMSMLQELNGRNANNPLSHLSMEHPYGVSVTKKARKNAKEKDKTEIRPLRVDLHIRLDGLKTGTELLAAYGWRHSNWVEAKYFRKTQDGTKNVGLLLADLIRLITLPDLEKKQKWNKKKREYDEISGVAIKVGIIEHRDIFSGRYLLHVYRGRAQDFLSLERNENGGRTDRPWVRGLLLPGRQQLVIGDLEKEPDGVMKLLGCKLARLKASIGVTNLVVSPRGLDTESEQVAYQCILTRIDSFLVKVGETSWAVTTDRRGFERPNNEAFDTIRQFVATNIALKEAEKQDQTGADVLLAGAGDQQGTPPAAPATAAGASGGA